MTTRATRSPLITRRDEWLFSEGTHTRLYDKLGAHLMTVAGTPGVHFAVWAPNARGVSVTGDFDDWHERRHPLHAHGDSGLWSTFVPGVAEGELYKFAIDSPHVRDTLHKADPFAFAAEMRPGTASRVADLSRHAWGDAEWIAERAKRDPLRTPMSTYEVHLGSWMRSAKGEWLSYGDAAVKLRDYVLDIGFTHVELLPGATLQLYIKDDISIGNNAMLNVNTADPTRMTIYYLGTSTMDLGNNEQIYARIVAPNAAVDISNNTQVFGSIVADSITLSQNAQFHQDTILARPYRNVILGGAGVANIRWDERP